MGTDNTPPAPATPPAAPKEPINIDADLRNANWLRDVARRRAEANGEPAAAAPEAPAPSPATPPAGTVPDPPVIEDVADVPLDDPTPPAPADNPDRPGFAAKGWSTKGR